MDQEEIVHGEYFLDGDASAEKSVVLYEAGTTTVRTLAANEYLYITDIVLTCETGGDVAVYFGTDVAGKRLLKMTVAAKSGYDHQYMTALCGPKGEGLKLTMAATNINFVVVEGYIRKA